MKRKYVIVSFFILLLFPYIVNASYNGGSGTGVSSGGSCGSYTSKFCYWNNTDHMTVRVSLYYFDESGKVYPIGKSVVYTNHNFKNYSEFNTFSVTGNSEVGYNASGLKSYFYDNLDHFLTLLNRTVNLNLTKSNYKDKLSKYFKEYCGDHNKKLSNCSLKASKTNEAKYGFRIVIEPYISGYKKGKFSYKTIKEVASEGGFLSTTGMTKYSMLLHTMYDDVGVKSYKTGTNNLTLVANKKTGYGYNIIDFAVRPDMLEEKCDITKVGVYKCCVDENIWKDHTENNTYDNLEQIISNEDLEKYCSIPEKVPGECDYKIDSKIPSLCTTNNTGNIKDNTEWSCAYKSSDNKDKNIQEHYYDYSNDYCAIYCKEDINYTLPYGSNVVSSGRYLTIEQVSDSGSLAVLSPMAFKGNKVCRTTNKTGDATGVINRAKFETDFNEVENNINSSYQNYLSLKNDDEADPNDVAKAYENYKNYVSKRESIITQINSCSNRQVEYKFAPDLNLTYEEPVYGGSWDLKKTKKETKKETYYIGGNSSNGSSSSSTSNINYVKIMKYSCNESSGCIKSIEDSYPLTDWFEKSLTRTYEYDLPDNLYRYIDKATGRSYNTAKEAGDNYVTVEKSNLPIHYSTNPGDYDFSIKIKTLGKGNKFEKYFFEKKQFNGKLVYSKKMDYNCSYNVRCKDHIINGDCGIINDICNKDGKAENSCSSEGINVIYRPISLYNNMTFLNIDGKARIPGSNWNNDDVIDTYIYKNRGEQNYNVYKLAPMYEIVLTPNLMKEIKKHNKKMNTEKLEIYDNTDVEKVGIAGYADYDSMKCDNEGQNCVSSIIRKWGVTGCSIADNKTKSYIQCGNSTKW